VDEDPEESLVPAALDVPQSRMGEALALLGSEGIEADYRPRDGAILVAPPDENAARRLLDEVDLSEHEEPEEPAEPTVVWSARGASGLIAVALACAAVFWSTHLSGSPPTRTRLLEHGAISWSLVESGDLRRGAEEAVGRIR